GKHGVGSGRAHDSSGTGRGVKPARTPAPCGGGRAGGGKGKASGREPRAAQGGVQAPPDFGLKALAPRTARVEAFRHNPRHEFAVATALVGPAEVDREA